MSADISQGVRYDSAHAQAYDRKIRTLIPGYETLHELSSFLLLNSLPPNAGVLVAGSGTGEELVRYGKLAPTWQLTGIEPSVDMNAVAAQRINDAGLSAHIHLREGKPGGCDLGGPYDAVTSLLVMHFVPDDGSKARYLSALATALKPSGILLLADLSGQHGDAQFDRLFRTWRLQQETTRTKRETVELDFAHLQKNVHPLSNERRDALMAECGLVIEQEYWRALGLSAVIAIKR